MLNRWAETWASFPPLHKKRFIQGVAAYGVLVLVGVVWIAVNASAARKDWAARKPMVEAPVKTIYLTPQLTEATTTFEFDSSGTPPADGAQGYVSIIMSEAGLTAALTERALDDLPSEIALAFSPYTPNLGQWIAQARKENRDSLVLLPMEPATFPKDDPGPKALLTRLSDKENERNLGEILSAAQGSVGVMNFMGTRFMLNEEKLEPVLGALQKRGALFVETPSAIKTLTGELAPKTELPYLAADLQIDAKATDADVKQQLLALEKLALERGYAVGIAQPYPVTFNLLKAWSESLESRGVKLVSLAALWKAKQKQEDAKQQEQQQPEQPAPDETKTDGTEG